jgi:hypothetical protein
MKKQIATALLLSMGLTPGASPAGLASFGRAGDAFALTSGSRETVARCPSFGTLRSAGWFKRNQVATFSFDDGRLWAEWSGQLVAPQPLRVEMAELDAEWMAHTPAARPEAQAGPHWFLARRDLQPGADGRFWSIYVQGMMCNPGEMQLASMTETADARGGPGLFTVSYAQQAHSVRLAFWGESGGQRQPRVDLAASDLRTLMARHPEAVRSHLAPMIVRFTGSNLLTS